MTVGYQLESADAVREWMLGHLTKGEGLTRPYHRKWRQADAARNTHCGLGHRTGWRRSRLGLSRCVTP